MDVVAVLNFLLIAGAIQGFLFNLVTFLARKKIEPAVVHLNLFVFFLSLNNVQSWFLDKGFLTDTSLLNYLTFPWYVFIVPMFYAFLVYYLEVEKKKWPFIKITIGLFIIELVTRVTLLVLVQTGRLQVSILEDYNVLEDTVTLGYSIFLYFKSLRLLYAHNELYSSILTYDNLRWVKRFLKIGGLVISLWVFAVLLNIFSDYIKAPYSYYPLRLGSSILIYWVGYQAFFQYVILKDRIKLRARMAHDGIPLTLKSSSPRVHERKYRDEDVFSEVDRHVITNNKFLNPSLGLESLSEELSISPGTLSRLINLQAGKNFSDYINEYRVEEAKRLLADPEFHAYTIVAIGLECGFNSKSTFYSAFRKFTGMTPTAWKAQYAR